MTTNFRYDKETIYKEFDEAKQKDILIGKGDDNKSHKHRITLLREYIKLEDEMPEVFEYVSMNFKRLLDTYLSVNPRDTFYRKVFGKSFEQVDFEQKPQKASDYS